MTKCRADRLYFAIAIVLLLLAAVYQIKGNVELIAGISPGAAVDLRSRDFEQRHFERGENPFDYMTASQPPWGYLFGLVLTWPDWPAVRIYFAVLNALALAFLMWFAHRELRSGSPSTRWLGVGAVAAFGGSCTATEVGQVSIIVTALLAAAIVCDRADRPWLCGLLVALALIKPTMSVPFAVALLLTRRLKAAAMAAGYGTAASIVTWLIVGASPLQMLRQLAYAATLYIGDGTLGLADALAALGASPAGVALAPLIIAVPCAILIAVSRAPLTTAFAIAAVWGRLWTYHKSYDDVMMALLMLPLAVLAFGPARSRPALLAFFAIGALEWLPGRVLDLPVIQALQLIVWPVSLLLLLSLQRSLGRVPADASPKPQSPSPVLAT